MDNISVGRIPDFSTLLWLDNATPEQLLCQHELTGLQDVTTAAGQSVAGQSEGFAQHQVRVANPHVGSSYRLSHYDPPSNEGQMNDCLNTVQEPPVIRRSPPPVYPGMRSFNQQEFQGNSLCCAINLNDSERRVTSYPPDYPKEASPAYPFTTAIRNFIRRNQNKAKKQSLKATNHTIVTTALRKKILSRKSDKSTGITADAGNILLPGICEKDARGTAPLRKRVANTSSVKSNRASKRRSCQ